MSQQNFEDVLVTGTLTARVAVLPSSCIGDTQVQTGADISALKLIGMFAPSYIQKTGTAVVADAAVDMHIASAAGSLMSLEAAITGVIATGADRTVTIDLQKSTGAGAFATVLSAVLTLNNASVLRTLQAATITTLPFVDGDILRLVIAVAGAAGNQAQGLIVTLRFWQKAQ